MGAIGVRTRKQRVDDFTRERIQTTQIVKRLTAHTLGQIDMTPSMVSAGLGLLRKALPDLAQTQITGDIEHTYVARLPDVAPSADVWIERVQQRQLQLVHSKPEASNDG